MPSPEKHRRLVSVLPEPSPLLVADLGCGDGRTLATLRERFGPELELVGVERREPELTPELEADPRIRIELTDLNKRLPFEDATVGGAICFDTLEALTSTESFLAEVLRVLAPGGHLLLSAKDYDTMVFNSSDIGLTRRLVHAFADTQEQWMDSADGTIGRKLRQIGTRSPFELVDCWVWAELDTEFAAGEAADHAVHGIQGAVRRDRHHELASRFEGWVEDLRVRAAHGEFLFSVNDYAVLLRRPDAA